MHEDERECGSREYENTRWLARFPGARVSPPSSLLVREIRAIRRVFRARVKWEHEWMVIRQSVRTLRTFQVFRAAYKLDAGEQRYAARQQHREATQIHVSLPAGLRRRGIPSGTRIHLMQSRVFGSDKHARDKRAMITIRDLYRREIHIGLFYIDVK